MHRSQQISNAFDIVVPLLLYFVWDWDLHFILLFAYIDALAGVAVSFFKERKIEQYKNTRNPKSSLFLLRNLGFVVLGIYFYELAIGQIYPELELWSSFVDFLLFEEMGIPQFALIFPLIILLNYQQYQLLFIKTNAFQFFPLVFLQNKNRNTWLLFLVSAAFIFGLSVFLPATPLLYLCLILGIKSLFDFVLIPSLDKKFVKQYVNSQHDFTR
jgi:hypothetical protein